MRAASSPPQRLRPIAEIHKYALTYMSPSSTINCTTARCRCNGQPLATDAARTVTTSLLAWGGRGETRGLETLIVRDKGGCDGSIGGKCSRIQSRSPEPQSVWIRVSTVGGPPTAATARWIWWIWWISAGRTATAARRTAAAAARQLRAWRSLLRPGRG